jgi:hypothetical protein
MKNRLLIRTILLFLCMGFLFAGRDKDKNKNKNSRSKTFDSQIAIKGNNFEGQISNFGRLFWAGGGSGSGGIFPAPPFSTNEYDLVSGDPAAVIYASGLWIAGKINGNVKAAASIYDYDYVPGEIHSVANDANLTPNFTNPGPTDTKYKIYWYFSDRHVDFLERLKNDASSSQKLEEYATSELAVKVKNGTFKTEWQKAIAQGAPVVPPGDVAAFSVYHDADQDRRDDAGLNTERMNIQVRQLTFLFRQDGSPVNDAVFVKYEFINKNPVPVDSVYASVWADMDVGNATDDYVGSDKSKGLGYTYNGKLRDAVYSDVLQVAPPAAGYDFFQGAIVDSTGSTVVQRGNDFFKVYINKDNSYRPQAGDIEIPNKIVLPSSSFVYYNNNGSVDGNPANKTHIYNYMRALNQEGNQFEAQKIALQNNKVAEEDKNFFFNGDPFNGTGWLDSDPNDRRFMLNCGPFTLDAYNDLNNNGKEDFGDAGYNAVVFGAFASIGKNNVSSVSKLLDDDLEIQAAFDNAFNLIPNPPPPIVTVRPYSVVAENGDVPSFSFSWESGVSSYVDLQGNTKIVTSEDYDEGGYVFEGYELVQFLQDPAINENDYRTISVFDRSGNLVTNIAQLVFDQNIGELVTKTVIAGTDGGVANDYIVQEDQYSESSFKGLTYQRGYFYGIRAYAYNEFPANGKKVRFGGFSKIVGIKATKTPIDIEFSAQVGTNLTDSVNTDLSGGSDGVVRAVVVDPLALIDATYRVYFTTLTADKKHTGYKTNGGVIPAGTLVWNLERTYNGSVEVIRSEMPQIEDGIDELGYTTIVDGIRLSVTGAPLAFKSFEVTANNAGPLASPVPAAAAYGGFPTPGGADPGDDQQALTNNHWLVHAGGAADNSYDAFVTRGVRNGWGDIVPFDFEMRFNADTDNFSYEGFNDNRRTAVPFELWNTSLGVRYIPSLLENVNDNDQFDLTNVDHEASGGGNDPFTDWVYWYKPTDMTAGESGYQAWLAGTVNPPRANETIARMVLVLWNGGDAASGAYDTGALPEPGTIFRFVSTKPNQPTTEFRLESPGSAKVFSNEVAAKNINQVSAFPNPYFGGGGHEDTKKRIVFINLPSQCQIQIYNLAGELVNKLDKNNNSSTAEWLLNNSSLTAVASGIYFAVVKLPTGENRVLKLAVLIGKNRPFVY